jgi:hypothetical protein
MQGILMADHPEKRCVVVFWSDKKQAIVSYTLNLSKVRAVTSRLFPLELPAAEYNNVFDDEFARRFGGATLKLLALSNPDLKPFIKVTDAAD